MEREIDRTDLMILSVLVKLGSTNELKAFSTKTLVKKCNEQFSYSKIKGVLLDFLEEGYVREGLKQGQSKSYYITDKGTKIYNYYMDQKQREEAESETTEEKPKGEDN